MLVTRVCIFSTTLFTNNNIKLMIKSHSLLPCIYLPVRTKAIYQTYFKIYDVVIIALPRYTSENLKKYKISIDHGKKSKEKLWEKNGSKKRCIFQLDFLYKKVYFIRLVFLAKNAFNLIYGRIFYSNNNYLNYFK